MLADEFSFRIRQAFGHQPTGDQQQAIECVSRFLSASDDQSVMVLRGTAGTGKTSLAAAVVQALRSLQQRMVLLAPTGRAAKVFSLYAGQAAYTIHRRIYRQQSLEGGFNLNFNTARDTLFLVDEASMIATVGQPLLDDLIHFVYADGHHCRLMLIGDHAQLPPVGEEQSLALTASQLRLRGLDVYESTLSEVVRQSQLSGILWNATAIRRQLEQPEGCSLTWPVVRVSGFSDVRVVPGDELIESLASSYSRVGLDETTVVTRSNKRANIFNQGIRNQVLDREEELCTGDRLMVVKNNYYWQAGGLEFIANGDHAVVRRVRHVEQLYGFRFAEVTMTFPDYDDVELTATVLLDTLTAESPALTAEQQEQLFQQVLADYADVPLKRDRLNRLKQDRYYNALQVKFAYAATCHKAQGGQWAHVYVDQGYLTADMLSADYIHWLYTAFTRATEQLYLVNWPPAQTENDVEKPHYVQ